MVNYNPPKTACLSVCIVLGSILFAIDAIAAEIKIGLRAHSGKEAAIQQWQATADYLGQSIPEHKFILIPYVLNAGLKQAVSRDEFDFILTNPAAYVEQKKRYGVSAIATLINKRKGKGYTRFGSVIFTRSDREDIKDFSDLKGKNFMGVDEAGFGGWLVARYELLKNNINPYTDFSSLGFAGGIQQKVVFSVLDGVVDAGSVRTDMLERMAARGEISLEKFKAIQPRQTKDFEFLHSTPLYPEWPFVRARHTSDELSRQVASVLYNIPSDSKAAKAGKYVGWTIPLDYSPVDELLRDLNVGPYALTGEVTLSDNKTTDWEHYLVMLLALIALFVSSYTIVRLNRKLKDAHNKLGISQNNKKNSGQ